MAKAVRVENAGSGVRVVVLDQPGSKVNLLSRGFAEEFDEVFQGLVGDPGARGLVISSAKQESFIVGADLAVLDRMETSDEAAALAAEGGALLSRVARAPIPIVAAVHGAAVGGGLEVALACHRVVASDHPATLFGLPEVRVGLLPAAGGTQRLPRRIGLAAALPLLLTGKTVRAKKARAIGLVDRLTAPESVVDEAVRSVLGLAHGRPRSPRCGLAKRLQSAVPLRWLLLAAARRRVRRETAGLYPAPLAILDCLAVGLGRGEAAGLAREAHHFGKLVPSPAAKNLIWLFRATGEVKKEAPDAAAGELPEKIAVLGGGFMGAGIASVALGHGGVVLRDVSESQLRKAAGAIDLGLEKQLRAGAIDEAESARRRARFVATLELDPVTECGLVIEAVNEELDLKRRVLAEAEERIAEDAVYATNTSALPISAISRDCRGPERVLGMHYFSPVHKMPLLEIVAGETTAAWAIERARAVGTAQGKTAIVVGDGPGFYTTRILATLFGEAIALLEQGEPVDAIDRRLESFGFPVGPFTLLDEVGIDVAAHIAETLAPLFATRGIRTGEVLPALHRRGLHGRKNGKGFYSYARGRRRGPNPEVAVAAKTSARRADVQDRLTLALINEAVYCLQEGILASPRDGDLGAVLGLGFPPFLGGPFRYIDALGAGSVRRRLLELTETEGRRFQPAPLLEEMAHNAGRFYVRAGNQQRG